MFDYIKTGKDFYFDLQVSNEDPISSVGKQTVVAKNCNLDSVAWFKFDSTSDDALEEEMPFTFSDVALSDSFKKPTGV